MNELFDYAKERLQAKEIRFNGSDYSPSKDDVRLTGQILRVFNCLKDGSFWTLKDISEETGDGQASVSSQIRHLKKSRWGSHIIEKRNLGYGLWEYRLVE